MAPLTKDAVEVTNSTSEASGTTAGAPGKTEQAGHLRADAVSLEVPVKVHGSRVKEVVRDVTPHTEPFEEQTNTMIVFPQGAVIRMTTSVNVGQMLVVTNLKSRQDAICRVVKVRTFSNLQGYVEVEFAHKQPGYWSVYFPSEGPAIVNKLAQPAAVAPAVPAVKKKPVSSASDISWAPAPSANASEEKPAEAASFSAAIKPPIAPPQIISPAKPEPSFVSIGRQEQVQAAASTIAPAPPAVPNFETLKKVPAQANASSVLSFPPAPVVEAPSISSLPDLQEAAPAVTSAPEFQFSTGGSDERIQSEASASDESARNSFGSLSGGASFGARGTPAAASEGGLDYTGASAHPKASGQNWTLIAVCLTLLVAVVGGGVFYIRTQSASNSAAKSSSPALTQPDTAANSNAPQTPQATAASQQIATPGRAAIANKPANVIANNGNAAAETHDSAVSATRPSTPAKQDAPHVTSDMMNATLNSHPVSSQRTGGGQDDAAPSLDGAAEPPSSTTGGLSGVMGSSDVASPPAPEIRPEGPVKIGGLVKEPKLLSSTLPVYPTFAKEAHIEGDVVIRTTIDKNGNVTHMEVVSGPTMLRQSALEALGRWKYVPSKLDGQPVSVQMLVTLKFHR
jgi:TonB family protein